MSFASSNLGDSSRKLCRVWGKERLRSYEYQNQQFSRMSHMIFPYSKYSSGFKRYVVGKVKGQQSAMKVESSFILRQMAQVVINFVFLLENWIKSKIWLMFAVVMTSIKGQSIFLIEDACAEGLIQKIFPQNFTIISCLLTNCTVLLLSWERRGYATLYRSAFFMTGSELGWEGTVMRDVAGEDNFYIYHPCSKLQTYENSLLSAQPPIRYHFLIKSPSLPSKTASDQGPLSILRSMVLIQGNVIIQIIMASSMLFDLFMHFVAVFLPKAQQYMMSNKQLGRNFLPNSLHPLPSVKKQGQGAPKEKEGAQSALMGILSYLSARKYAEAYSQSLRLKLPFLSELTRIAYEHNMLKYLLHTRDKIVQVNPEQHLLTQGGMANLRMAALYREEAGQAKGNYSAVAQNIRKMCTAGGYFQCTLSNRPEMTEIKTALYQLFQEMKNRQRGGQMQSFTASQATNADKENNGVVAECKENLLEIISHIVPTQTMKTGLNREKSLGQLAKMAKDHIKQLTANFQHELNLLQSRAHFCERTLQSERVTKLQREKQVEELQQELISSQQYIMDLQGMKAATEMENLGLHSKIRSSEVNDEREQYEHEIEKLRLEVEQLREELGKREEEVHGLREQLEEIRSEHEREHHEMQGKLERVYVDMQAEREQFTIQIDQLHFKRASLEQTLEGKQAELRQSTQEIRSYSQQLMSTLQQSTTIRQQKQQMQMELQKMEYIKTRYEQYPEQMGKLQEQMEALHSHQAHLQQSLRQEQEKRASHQTLIDNLQRLLQEAQQERTNLHDQLQILSTQGQRYYQTARDLEQKVKEMQEELDYITAQGDHYERLAGVERDEKSVETVVTLEDLRMIEESLANLAQRESELQELYSQNQMLRNQLCEREWPSEHA